MNEEIEVPKTRPAYPPEYRDQIIALARSGRSPEDLAAEFEPSAQTIRTWINQAKIDSGQAEGTTSDDKAELARLRRENAQLREEREILRKATAFFVRETSR
ncbi:transposase [Nocardiopsis metallicus]|uniref:Transposase n=1 Tax=Nocardiopsis metallicus TaxID=179819 RepID=A0A840WG11_9ACTN|nr:transposase [Nocardiopsis metallicus]MBB5489853.1 transposase [Nocardiopsis metallicus]MBB5491426.1 transposase [Nocardiopsis metallicus]MBB5491490.1 transposase [Nocardiopsis metallicus]MBB5491941.1 transposase [Nocardiopsis metallicus]MBB5491954.1 transposase [Nocardiopsis metallicus]